VARAEICLDAEAVRTPRLRAADAATLLLIYALGARGLGTAAASAHGAMAATLLGMRLGWTVVLGLVALALLRRAPPVPERRGLAVSVIAGALLGACVGASHRGAFPLFSGAAIPYWIGTALFVLAEEAIFRGALQRSLEEDLAWPMLSSPRWKARLAAGVLTGALGIVALALTTASPTGLAAATISLQLVAALARGMTGRVSASVVARLAALAVCTFL
jgi:membrane protease YdiL (CAAX protease family)